MEEVEKKKYDRFLNVESHVKTENGVDPITGFRYEHWDIGMVRNAREDTKKNMKVFIDPSPHVVLDQDIKMRGWYKAKVERPGVRNRPCFTEALLTQPYGGTCPVRCQMCYVNNGGRGYRGQGITVVDPQYPQKIEKQIKAMKVGFPVYVSSFTEPFQELENTYHITQQLGDIVVNNGLPIFYLTRMITPDWAIEHMMNSPYSYQQFSIITSNAADYNKFSPNCPPLVDILARMREISKLGIYISVQVNPIHPGITSNEEIIDLLHLLKANGANHVIFKFVEIVLPAAPEMVKRYTKLFPGRGEKFGELFVDNIGGMRTISEAYRIEALNLYKHWTAKLGLTMALCYEYKYERKPDGTILNKTGISMGKEYCSADQCHGKRTPMHIKGEDGLFHAFEGCPASGCLYCKETSGSDGPPCGSEILFNAKALTSSDYNKVYKEMTSDE